MTTAMTTAGKIDVHQHVLPPFWVEYLRGSGARYRLPDWSPDAAVAAMDAQGIATGFLSLTDPGVLPWPAEQRAAVARRVNDYTAELVARRPDRFGNLATLPLPDVDAAITEAGRALDAGADGVVLFTNYGDSYLGDPLFEPLWAELDRRAAVVLVHPNRTALPDLVGVPPAMVDFPFTTTRAAVHMVTSGVLDRHTRISVVLAHAGGFLPYAAHRFAMGGATLPGAPDADALLRTYQRFHLDTALSASPTAIPSLTAFADPGHIVFGSDFPYAAGISAEFTRVLDTTPLLSAAQRTAITRVNAQALFPGRFALSGTPA